MKLETRAFLAFAVTTVVGVAAIGAYILTAPRTSALVPAGSFTLTSANFYRATFTYANTVTAAYRVTGAWQATAPVQVIVAAVLGLNFAGCGMSPLNYPSGSFQAGCWPVFEATSPGAFAFAFHICVLPNYLPTGSFEVIFRSSDTATVTLTQPFDVHESEFPQTSCTTP